MKRIIARLFMVALIAGFTACNDGGTDVVESGTYQGTVKEVEAEKTEIYVETTDGKTLELYFTEATKLTRNGQAVDFSTLAEGQKVEVQVNKVGKRLDPLTVQIME